MVGLRKELINGTNPFSLSNAIPRLRQLSLDGKTSGDTLDVRDNFDCPNSFFSKFASFSSCDNPLTVYQCMNAYRDVNLVTLASSGLIARNSTVNCTNGQQAYQLIVSSCKYSYTTDGSLSNPSSACFRISHQDANHSTVEDTHCNGLEFIGPFAYFVSLLGQIFD